jgi:guanylate kinase
MIVLVGASASGKSTLQKAMIERSDKFKKVVTYTTRPPRKNEKNGIDYHFISERKFQILLEQGFFIEHAEYRGWHYGTAKNDCKQSDDYIAVLTPSGYRALKRLNINTTSIYLYVDRRSLMMNILQRGDDIDEAYRRNLSDVGQFDGIADEVDYVIDNTGFHMDVNEVLECVDEILGENNERV